MAKTLRLLLGDQLNSNHSWFNHTDPDVLYVLMEIRPETDYALHHIQKVIGFFSAMRAFAGKLKDQGHVVHYVKLDDPENKQSFAENLIGLIQTNPINRVEYQIPDEWRLYKLFQTLPHELNVPVCSVESEHFFIPFQDMEGYRPQKGKRLVMETFYRRMRKETGILMENSKPVGEKWNYDQDNRKRLPKGIEQQAPAMFQHDVSDLYDMVQKAGIKTIGTLNPKAFTWTVSRAESLDMLDFFLKNYLAVFGTYQDAMKQGGGALFHSRLSFSLNTKMLSPKEVVEAALNAWQARMDEISLSQVEGFVRQILGWREYMRLIYWNGMPGYKTSNFFQHQRSLPAFYWTGETKLNCLHHAINESLQTAYAHHIQRLMVTGNFALLCGVHPDEVDRWYLGIYMDAIEWVELPNTRGMSQFADGGMVATKPYVSSANYIHKMSDYCSNCHYNHKLATGEKACPFNALYWRFFMVHQERLKTNNRLSFVYKLLDKKTPDEKKRLMDQAETCLRQLHHL